METKLDPYLLSSAGKKRKQELILEFLNSDSRLAHHSLSCPVTRDGNFEVDCDICKKFLLMVNILIHEEKKRNAGKLKVKKEILDYIVFK